MAVFKLCDGPLGAQWDVLRCLWPPGFSAVVCSS